MPGEHYFSPAPSAQRSSGSVPMTIALSSHVQSQGGKESGDPQSHPNFAMVLGYAQSSNGLRTAQLWLTACTRSVVGNRVLLEQQSLRHMKVFITDLCNITD